MKATRSLLKGLAAASLVAAAWSTAANAEGLKLSLWHNSADSPALMDLYKRYEQASGNTLELVPMPADGFETATLTRWATGERPDIMENHGFTNILHQYNALENMRELTDEPVLQNGSPIYQVMGQIDGKRFAVTVGYPSVFGIFYNKEILDRNGIAVPQNITDLASACEILKQKDPGVAPIFEAGGSAWPTQIIPLMLISEYNQNGEYSKAVTERAIAVNDPDGPLVKAVGEYAKLRDSGCFNEDALTATFEDSFGALVKGKAAFVAQNSGLLSALDAAADGDLAKVDATVGFASVSMTRPAAWFFASPLGTYYLPKTGDAAREEAALGFVRYVTGEGYDQYVLDSGEPPVLSGATMPPLRSLKLAVNEAYKKAVPAPDIVGFVGFDVQMTRLLAKQVTAQEAADQLAITIEQQSKAAGLPGW